MRIEIDTDEDYDPYDSVEMKIHMPRWVRDHLHILKLLGEIDELQEFIEDSIVKNVHISTPEESTISYKDGENGKVLYDSESEKQP